jgi:hypothetical protein
MIPPWRVLNLMCIKFKTHDNREGGFCQAQEDKSNLAFCVFHGAACREAVILSEAKDRALADRDSSLAALVQNDVDGCPHENSLDPPFPPSLPVSIRDIM